MQIMAAVCRLRDYSFALGDRGSPHMPEDEHVRIAAQHMIDRYQDAALAEVDQRIVELREQGEVEALHEWIRIRAMVEALLACPPAGKRH